MTNRDIDITNAEFDALINDAKEAARLFRCGLSNTAVYVLVRAKEQANTLAQKLDIDTRKTELAPVERLSATRIIA